MAQAAPGRMAPPVCYLTMASRFGRLALVWDEAAGAPRVRQVFLPRAGMSLEGRVRARFPQARRSACPSVLALAERMQCFLEGRPVQFHRKWIALDQCPPFQRQVLLLERQVPRGQVTTYARLAQHLGAARAARAVGQALARNPFPIFIPCHRAVRSDGALGGFQGGLKMKRVLLKMEGVKFTLGGKIAQSALH